MRPKLGEKDCPICWAGDNCDRGDDECPLKLESALDAGIPLDVITGKRKITDGELSALGGEPANYREDMIDAGRGRLLR